LPHGAAAAAGATPRSLRLKTGTRKQPKKAGRARRSACGSCSRCWPTSGSWEGRTRISRARPKIADYPFTTTEPHLGIVPAVKGRSSFVVADIPGLIEGSHTGKGLGIRFLRHIERTRVLAVLIDATTPDPEADAKVLLHELARYSALLAELPRCLILTKSDLIPKEEPYKVPSGWLSMSAVTGENVDTVINRLSAMVEETKNIK
jgi:GTP-binding protein